MTDIAILWFFAAWVLFSIPTAVWVGWMLGRADGYQEGRADSFDDELVAALDLHHVELVEVPYDWQELGV